MIKLALYVGIGGFFGSIGRYLISHFSVKLIPDFSFIGTLIVNVVGSFLLGVLIHASTKMDREMYLLLTTGFCGGFTTFSTFSAENIQFLTSGNYANSLLYMALSLVFGLGAAMIGWYFGKNYIGI